LEDPDEELISQMIYNLLWWRFMHVNPTWGFLIGGGSHLMFQPRRPQQLFKWIDDFLVASGERDRVKAFFAAERDRFAALYAADRDRLAAEGDHVGAFHMEAMRAQKATTFPDK
jgi:hypothetical protein